MPVIRIGIAGIQRTGTNFVQELIERHFGVPVFKPFWKHLMVGENYSGGLPVHQVLDENRNLRIAVVVKHPLMWLESVLTRRQADLFKTRGEMLTGEGEELAGQLGRLYGVYYEGWLQRIDTDPFVRLVRYEDALSGDYASVIAALAELAPSRLPEGVYATPLVDHSTVFTEVDRERYLRQSWDLPDPLVAAFLDGLGEKVASLYGGAAELARRPAEENEAERAANQALQRIRRAVDTRGPEVIEAIRDEADQLMALVLDRLGEDQGVLYLVGRLEQKLGRKKRGAKLLLASLERAEATAREHPGRFRAWTFLADVQSALGQPGPAVAALSRAVALRPGDRGARLQLCDLLLRAKDVEAAATQLEAARAAGAGENAIAVRQARIAALREAAPG